MLFWVILVAMVAGVAALLARAILRGGSDLAQANRDSDLAVYRDQLDELTRDVARGLISAEAAEQTKVEISRRILDANRKLEQTGGSQGPRWMALGAAAVVFALTAWLYWTIGAPGYGDMPLQARLQAAEALRADRPSQAEAEAVAPTPPPIIGEDAALVQRLRDVVAARPDDVQGLTLLARTERQLGNYSAGRAALQQALAQKGAIATGQDFAELADLLVLAAGGLVTPEADTAIAASLGLDPQNGTARYLAGLGEAQIGRFDRAFGIWRSLLEDSAPTAPWITALRSQLPDVADRAGIRFTLPALAAPGPTAEDMVAAQDLSPEDQAAMIEGMVAGLSDRLATEGGTPAEWAQLVRALGVLGRTDQARAILGEARQVFATHPDLAVIEAAGATLSDQ